jgi:hypothetical protein
MQQQIEPFQVLLDLPLPSPKSCEIRPIGGASNCYTIGYADFGVSYCGLCGDFHSERKGMSLLILPAILRSRIQSPDCPGLGGVFILQNKFKKAGTRPALAKSATVKIV